MLVIRKIKRKAVDFFLKLLEGYNRIDENAVIHKETYIKGSQIYGEVVIGKRATLYKTVISGNVTIGRFSSLWGPNIFLLSSINQIKIGSFCSIARNVTFQEYFHDSKKLSTFYIGRNLFNNNVKEEQISKGNIILGNDVWIGINTTIMSGVSIGNGAIIGANSVVTKNVPAYAVAVGSPAKVVKYRFNVEVIEKLDQLKWWDWTEEKIKRNEWLFSDEVTLENLNNIKE